MAVLPNSYGTAADVAPFCPRYVIGGAFTAGSAPTLAVVESWIDQVSAALNVALKGAGFTIPVTQSDAVLALKSLVVSRVVDLCHAAHSTGRFYNDKVLARGGSAEAIIRREICEYVENEADGLELLGAARTRSSMAGLLYRDEDESGNETFPIFQRNGFSNRFTDWDGG